MVSSAGRLCRSSLQFARDAVVVDEHHAAPAVAQDELQLDQRSVRPTRHVHGADVGTSLIDEQPLVAVLGDHADAVAAADAEIEQCRRQ
jgi:hypothetical protein